MQIVIDADNAILGRLAAFAAKQALNGNHIVIVNSEKAIIIGGEKDILAKYKKRRARGKGSLKGPYFPSKPAAILKRVIRGMLPYKKAHGKEAFKRTRCYEGLPTKYKDAKKIISKREKPFKFITLEKLCKLL